MPSLQFQLMKVLFRLRAKLSPPSKVLNVEKERAETESLAGMFKNKFKTSCMPVDANGVPAEWIATSEAAPERVVLYFHGGSYNSGSLNSHRSLVANIAKTAGVRILNVDYRLAPEHPFPAAVEDAVTAYQWLLKNNISPSQIIAAGDSAGGGLALALLLSLRDAGEHMPAAAVCLSPWTDLSCTGNSWKANAKKDFMLSLDLLLQSAQLYLGNSDPRSPLASPLYADLKGLPPVLIQVGSDEMILSDSTNFAEQARAQGVDITLEIWEGMQHEWQFAANLLPEGKRALDHIGQYIKNHI